MFLILRMNYCLARRFSDQLNKWNFRHLCCFPFAWQQQQQQHVISERVKHDELPHRKFASSSGLRFNAEFMSIQIVNYGRVMIEIRVYLLNGAQNWFVVFCVVLYRDSLWRLFHNTRPWQSCTLIETKWKLDEKIMNVEGKCLDSVVCVMCAESRT